MTINIKRIFLIAASLFMLIGAAGCMENNSVTITLDEAKKAVLDYLSQKYKVAFECIGYQKPSFLNERYTFALVEEGKSYDGYGFTAHYTLNSVENITDGYFGVLIRDEITEYILNSNFCDKFKVFADVSRSTFDSQLDSSSTLSDAVKIHGKLRVYYYIFISSENEYDIEKLKAALPSDILCGKVSYYVVSDAKLSDADYNNLNSILGSIADRSLAIESKGNFEF